MLYIEERARWGESQESGVRIKQKTKGISKQNEKKKRSRNNTK
jgi:hypothetical protein